MTTIKIQVQDVNMNWFTIKVLQYINEQMTMSELKQTQNAFPGKRVKAVDQNGRLLDILG
jgi:hypothetical protein